MKEELIRIENSKIESRDGQLTVDFEISRGACIGILADSLVYDEMILGFFRGELPLQYGKAYLYGEYRQAEGMEKIAAERAMVIERQKNFSSELSAWDYLTALRGKTKRSDRKAQIRRFYSPEAEQMRKNLEIDFPWESRMHRLSRLDFCRLALFKAWFYQYELIILTYMTEFLREKDREKMMEYSGYLLQKGMAFFLLDQDSDFLFQYADRIDIIKNGSVCFRLDPEDYDPETLSRILRGKRTEYMERFGADAERLTRADRQADPVLEFDHVSVEEGEELTFQLGKGEIGVLSDTNYRTAQEIQSLFLEGKKWERGIVTLHGRICAPGSLPKFLGKEVGIQMEGPGKKGRTLLYDRSALENLSCMLIPKTGSWLVKKKIEENIRKEAETWFPAEELQKNISQWPMEQRLKFSYYKWYLVNPQVLICLFPFSGVEMRMYGIIMDMLSACAERGTAILIISTDVEAVCEKASGIRFIKKLRRLEQK